MNLDIYLQIISILMAVIAVGIPTIAALVIFVYIRKINETVDSLSDEVNLLWGELKELSDTSTSNNQP